MLGLNLSSTDTGTWFYFDPDNPDAGGVCLRELTSEELRRIDKLTVTVKKKFKRGAWLEDKTTDEQLVAKMRWNFIIVDWKQISIDGQSVECTTENKVRAMKINDFVKIVADGIEELVEENTSLEEARVKNSGDSSDGDADP